MLHRNFLIHTVKYIRGNMYPIHQHKLYSVETTEGILHLDEEALYSRDDYGHRTENPKEMLPLVHTDTTLVMGYLPEYLHKVVKYVWWRIGKGTF